jgi:hypothetical protein
LAYEISYACPVCTETMEITELTCPSCKTQLKGTFKATNLNRLTKEQLQFVEIFVKCRGSIKEVEKELKISYPTVRSRLEQVISAMGFPVDSQEEDQNLYEQSDVIDSFANGNITFEETIAKLKEAKKR